MKRILTYLLVSTLAFISCSNEVNRKLMDVEDYIQERPDSALAVLRSIENNKIKGVRTKAKFSLLHAMALDKNGVDTCDLNIIQPASDYYTRFGNNKDKQLTYYYLGRIQQNGNNLNEAIVSFVQSIENATSNYLYKGMAHFAIALCYEQHLNYKEALGNYERARQCFLESGKTTGAIKSQIGVANCLSNLGEIDEAEAILREIIKNNTGDDTLMDKAKMQYAFLIIREEKGSFDEAVSLLDSIISNGGNTLSFSGYWAYAYALYMTGHETAAQSIADQLQAKNGTPSMFEARLYFHQGDFKAAFECIREALDAQNIKVENALQHSLDKTQTLYFQEKEHRAKEHARTLLFIFSSIVLLLVTLLLLFILITKAHSTKEKAERERLILIAQTAELQLSEQAKEFNNEKTSHEAQLRSTFVGMYRSQFKVLGEMLETMLLSKNTLNEQKFVYENVSRIISSIEEDKSGHKSFEKMIDRDLSGIMTDFRHDFPNLDEDDYRFASYLFVGFNATLLLMLMDMPSHNSVYARKSRLRKTVSMSTSSNKERYLAWLK